MVDEVTEASLSQSAKTSIPTSVRESGSVIEVSAVFWKALFPIVWRPEPKLTEVSDAQP